MRIRVRGPDGVSTLSLPDTATIVELKAQIASALNLPAFQLKYGYPPKPLDLDAFDDTLPVADTGIKFDGEQLIATSKDITSILKHPLHDPPTIPAPVTRSQGATVPALPPINPSQTKPKPQQNAEDDPPEVAVPDMSGTLVLRVMPDDNSCLFRALSYAVLGDFDSMPELRDIVATQIQSQPEVYTEAVLEKTPDNYCRWIKREESWGGAIELGILSQHFNIEICSISVQDLRVDRFNEGQSTRCILVYSGIHYDVIVLNPSTPPFKRANASPELDQKVFEAVDDAPLIGALELCRILQTRHYYTDTAGFTVRCGDCGWQGKGEKEAIQHAQQTNHYNFGEA